MLAQPRGLLTFREVRMSLHGFGQTGARGVHCAGAAPRPPTQCRDRSLGAASAEGPRSCIQLGVGAGRSTSPLPAIPTGMRLRTGADDLLASLILRVCSSALKGRHDCRHLIQTTQRRPSHPH